MKSVFTTLTRVLIFLIGIYTASSYGEYQGFSIFSYEGTYPILSVKKNCSFIEGLSDYQKDVMYKIHHISRPYNLQLTAIAIAWKESKLGKYKVRMGNTKYDRSFGVMHTVTYWKTKGMTPFEKGVLIQSLIQDDVKSITLGLEDILYWQRMARFDWKKGIAMYNAGSSYSNGLDYAEDIKNIVKELNYCEIR